MSLQTVYRTFNPAEAQVVRSRLDASGIPAVVTHETATLSIQGYSQATGGVRVEVPESFLSQARALLDSYTESDAPEAE